MCSAATGGWSPCKLYLLYIGRVKAGDVGYTAHAVHSRLLTHVQVDARNIDGSTPLCDACAAGNIECVKLLLEYGATVNPPLFTFSPLHEACMGGKSTAFYPPVSRQSPSSHLYKLHRLSKGMEN